MIREYLELCREVMSRAVRAFASVTNWLVNVYFLDLPNYCSSSARFMNHAIIKSKGLVGEENVDRRLGTEFSLTELCSNKSYVA